MEVVDTIVVEVDVIILVDIFVGGCVDDFGFGERCGGGDAGSGYCCSGGVGEEAFGELWGEIFRLARHGLVSSFRHESKAGAPAASAPKVPGCAETLVALPSSPATMGLPGMVS
jgi:hypothetical protein